MGRMLKRVMTHKASERLGGMKNAQDGSREFITMLACISAIGKAIPSLLIYKGSNEELQTSWVEDVTEESNTYFTSSENGWSGKKIGLRWLEEVFNRHARPSSSRAKRLLIVDGHSSHVNWEFIKFADHHRIIVLILPPHTTHKLQPLDVGMFQSISTAYSIELDKLISQSQGFFHMSKRYFFKLFKLAFDKSFTESAIQHAFAKPGIWPVNRHDMIRAVTRPNRRLEVRTSPLKTPRTASQIRHFQIAYHKNPSSEGLVKLFKALTIATTSESILIHDNNGLREALKIEQQKRKRAKKLDLSGELNLGTILYSPAKVVRCREYQAQQETLAFEKEREKEARRLRIEANKIIKAQKQQEKEDRAVEAQLRKEQNTQNSALSKAPSSKPNSIEPRPKKAPSKVPKLLPPSARPASLKSPKKRAPKVVISESEQEDSPIRVSRTGRAIALPSRFQK
jgi:hypothetical protein